jgi:hypothetical protein
MTAEEVRSILGDPHESFITRLGQESEGGAWDATVWIYFGERDERYLEVERLRKDMFFFYPPDGDMRLNHWVLEVERRSIDGVPPENT